MFVEFEKSEIEQAISRRFAATVQRHGDRVALRFDGRAISYRQLDERSNRIANGILSQRGDRQEPVAVRFGQGFAAVAGILGLWKAGKAYVPIDPWMAPQLQSKLLAASGAAMVLTDDAEPQVLLGAGQDGGQAIDLEALSCDEPLHHPQVAVSPERLAYIFFTSGTTGEPKGVADCHRNVLHNAMRYTNSLCVSPQDRLSLIQPWSFSGTVSSLLSALLNGATLCLYDLRRDGLNRLARWTKQERITIFHSVPHIFEQLVAPGEVLSDLRIVRLEGDKASSLHAALFNRHFHEGCRLVNGLGTTETGLVCQYFLSPGDDLPKGVLPVGHAKPDFEIGIVDSDGKARPAGEAGEIVVRSRYLAQGYWQRPELTRARFLPDPEDGESRSYRTGDIGRLRSDGCLEYLGRANAEVQIRGQRVETDAIEAALVGLPEIRKALVTAHEDATGHQSLIAYLVPEPQQRLPVDRLRRQLGEGLPPHAIPAKFIPLEDLPVTPIGKVDRSALVPPTRWRPDLDVPFVLPRDLVEVHLKDIWQEVLGLEPVGMRDDFFDLGGDSLLATEMLFRIEALFGVTLTLNTLWLESTTIEEIAALLRGQAQSGFWRQPAALQPQGDKPPIFCVHLEGGHLWPYRQLARISGEDRPIFGLPARGADGAGPADSSLETMADHCLTLMRQQQPEGPYHLVGFSSGGILAFEVARQLVSQGGQMGVLIIIDSPPENLWTTFGRALRTPLAKWRPRLIQERLYQIALDGLGLSRLRRLRGIGESHRWAFWRYRPKPYAGALNLVRCSPGGSADLDDWGWARLVEGPIEVHAIEGPNHKALMHEPQVQALADYLRSSVARAESEAPLSGPPRKELDREIA